MREFWDDFGKPVGTTLGVIVLVLLIGIRILQQASWVSSSTQIEQLRSDARNVDSKMAEDVAGQVASVNREIATAKRWRTVPFIRLFWPSGWDDVKLIDMPKIQ